MDMENKKIDMETPPVTIPTQNARGSIFKDLVVNNLYQIRFWKEGDQWVVRWSDKEMEFHQKMMDCVNGY